MKKIATPERIEIWQIDRLKLNPKNARTHSPEQIEELARSMQAWGFMSAVVADSDGMILAGHARVLAAKKLGLSQVPVILADHLTEAEKMAFAIADNQIALHAGWDLGLLKVQLEALKAEKIDLALVGFDQTELDRIVDKLERDIRAADEDSVPEIGPVVTRVGDLWDLGDHRLLCGDGTESESFSVLLEGEMADMVFTDPPYNVAYQAPRAPNGDVRHAQIANDNLGSDFPKMLEAACRLMIANVNGAVYICMSSSELHTLYQAFTAAGGHWSTFLIWAKSTFALGHADYHHQFEPILYGWPEGQSHFWCGDRNQADLWFFDKPHANDLHPTMKPVALIERALLNSSQRGNIVLDPFGGSGSTLMASEKAGRRARLIEIEPAYCDVIIERWQQFTGRSAVLRADGITFEEVKAKRNQAAE